MDTQNPLLLEKALDWASQKANEYKVPLLASFLFGALAYGFFLTNKLVNWDDIGMMFSKGATLRSGRWGLDIMEWLLPNISMPFIYGIMTITLIGISVCIICHLFEIRSRLMQALLAGAVCVFPTLTGTMTFMFTAASYGLSFLLSVLSVLLIRKPSWKTSLPAIGCLVLSLSIYQAYVALAASLLVLILIQRLLRGDDTIRIVQAGFAYLLYLVVSLVSYYVITLLLQRILGVSFIGYASKRMSFQLSDFPRRIGVAYQNFANIFQDGLWGLTPTPLSRILHRILLAAVTVLLIHWGVTQKKFDLPRILLLVALVGILPLAINCMYLFAESGVHTLVLYSFVAFYVLAAILADLNIEKNLAVIRRVTLDVVSLTIAVILAVNIYTANTGALNMYLRYENAYAFYTTLAADIKMMPEFHENTKVYIAGHSPRPDFYEKNLSVAFDIVGTAGFSPTQYTKNDFNEYYVGFPFVFASDSDVEQILDTPEFEEMPCYPYYGSMKFFDNILVVKLS